MSSAKSRAISEINLEEFERRLRAAGAAQAGVEDPLSELTRLVNTITSERPRSEKVVDIATARMPKSEPFAAAPSVPPPVPVQNPPAATVQSPPAPPAPSPPPVVKAQREALSLPRAAAPPTAQPRVEATPPSPVAEEAEEPAPPLRASFEESIARPLPRPAPDPREFDDENPDVAAFESEFTAAVPLEAGDRISIARPPRPRSWYLKVAGLSALALVMGGAAAMKIGVAGMHRSPPLILAVDGPSKVAPPNEATVQSPGDTGALLLKDSAAPAQAPIKLVSTEEQPVDLNAQAPAASAPTPTADGQLAPAPSTPIVAPSEGVGGAPAPGSTLFPSPKRVKTVSVRPDGTLISSDSVPDEPSAQSSAPASSPAPAAAARKPENAGAAALAATPTIELQPKPAAKSSARVKSDALAEAGNAPLQLGPAKPSRSAKPKPAAVVADATPAGAPTNTTPTFETASAGGGWAVQLAAPRSESEAQSALTRLQKKYDGDLGSTSLAVHKAEVNGETIFRVRAGGLTKADALSLCSKLKASGGDCFVARNN